jgi:hypothetical protein
MPEAILFGLLRNGTIRKRDPREIHTFCVKLVPWHFFSRFWIWPFNPAKGG